MKYASKHGLTRMSQRLLYDKKKAALDQHRTVWCMRKLPSEFVRLYRQVSGEGARMTGTMQCGCVWTCPLCAGKICEGRRRELQAGAVHWIRERGHVYLLTLTFPHTAEDGLADLLGRQAKALQRFRNSRTYKRLTLQYGRIGSVYSLEVTVGKNGWHPHQHELIFALPGLLEDAPLIRRLKREWLRCCLKAGLVVPDGTLKPFRDFWRHSLDIRGGQFAAEYIAKYGRDEKWGITRELTSSHSKIGIRKTMLTEDMHFTPFQLLEWASNGDYGAAQLFREYAEAFAKKHMLIWSRGLKLRLGVLDLSDEELQRAPMPDEKFVGFVAADRYQVVLTRNAVGELLDFAATCCTNPETSQADLDEFIAMLEKRPPGHRGDILVGAFMATRDGDGERKRRWREWNAA